MDGRLFRALTVADDYSRQFLAQEVGSSRIGVSRLSSAPATRRALDRWAYDHGVRLEFIKPRKPPQNTYIESFNGKLRDECLNQH